MEVEIIVILVTILLSAFFSGMEIAFVSANRLQIELEKKNNGILATVLTRLTKKSSKFITTMLVGNNISLVIYSYFMGEVLTNLLGIGDILFQTLISTLVILITAEFLPKAIFRIYANEVLKLFAVPAYMFFVVFHYISEFMTWISDFCLRVFFNAKEDEQKTEFSKEELGNYITQQLEKTSDKDDVDSEIQIFQNALEFHNVKAREIMIPRTEIVALEVSDDVEELKKIFVETGYSKIIIYKESLDSIIGYVHAFEMFKQPETIKSVLLPIEMVPETMMINDILNILTKKKKSIAVVLDEYGGTSGIITVEDIVEELFGEIEDEHDTVELLDKQITENEFDFSARLEVDYINETYDLKIPKENAYETLGGFIVYNTENIPEKGEILKIGDYEFTILEVSATKIEELHLKIVNNSK
ncbi:hemolysin family protein [Aureivirga sp. CE67]|uniref:hemolysin family protein n=1 Tax=Aureivirga sp. CE67 TaxID=1788983 RepID=UPI0018CA96D0|nr:hemolysin family protein [Aureivirga sp. CE67]